MKTITFYSYKGGVGRTLALANIAKRLSDFDKSVCILDFDLEAPGVPFKFKEFMDISKIKRGIVDYISLFQETNIPAKSLLDYTQKINLGVRSKGPITIIPSGNSSYQEYWNKLSKINWSNLLYQENSQGIAFFLDLKSKIENEIKPDVLLIDSRTGISEISGIPLSILADEVVLVASNNEENIYGTIQIIRSLTNPNLRLLDVQPKITIVLSRIPYSIEPQLKAEEAVLLNTIIGRINDSLEKNNYSIKAEDVIVLHSDRDLEIKEFFKIGYEEKEDNTISTGYLSLFSTLTKDILTKEEILKFNNVRAGERYYRQSSQEKSIDKKLEYLKMAIKYDNTRAHYYSSLSTIYIDMKIYDKAINEINQAIKLAPNSINYLNQRANIKFHFMQDIEAIFVDYTKILELDPNSPLGYFGYGLYYNLIEKFEESIEWYTKSIEINPNDSVVYNNRACTYTAFKKYDEAFNDIYKALSINPEHGIFYTTLAEIYYNLNNENEFFRNLELALIFDANIELVLSHEPLYNELIKNQRFIKLIEKYNKQEAIEELMTKQKGSNINLNS
ncbi:MAG TPA: tetratricopeptide repeat protein [Bacteroidales bacterium]|nr:tetratricopeptide repeat protein [Bacteroidales bacterium]